MPAATPAPRRHRRRTLGLALAAALATAACATADVDGDGDTATSDTAADTAADAPRFRYPPAPAAPPADAPADAATRDAIDRIGAQLSAGEIDEQAVADLAESGDVRHAWYVADLMRFFGPGDNNGNELVDAFEQLTGTTLADDPDSERSVWLSATNHLIAWDTPDHPDYRVDKSVLFLLLEPKWEPFFADADATIDWRLLSWGGVLIDDRELGDTGPCDRGCIPALDDPATTDAAGGDWYPDDAIVFGVVEGAEALAIPKNIAEVHEMFNLTLGDRRFGIPYCTLCGSAQAYRTDQALDQGADDVPVLRTSGLLSRSNKVMYDLRTRSVFDTFTGAAVSGPLQDAGIVLEETTVVRSTWGEWKSAHPETRIIAEDGGIGRSYELDPLQGRDDDGPIFPIGGSDERLAVQELVVGVITVDGSPVAFPAGAARAALAAGEAVTEAGVELVADGGGLRAVDAETGDPIPSHESFWFAWSQFHPTTALWQS
jgi:hypothetical protein